MGDVTEGQQASAGTVPRFGVEEEFLLVDPVTRTVAPRAGAVIARARVCLGDRVSGEITHLQAESKTDPCGSVKELHEQLVQGRAVLRDSAAAEGLRVVATGSSVLPGAVPPPITEGPRQDQGNATFRGLHDDLGICALHVHVEEPDRHRALMISNHLRPWLPLLLGLTANSPYWNGRDTGYASWRTVTWTRWPVAGPPPYFTSVTRYDETVAALLAAGALVDSGTIFWDVRPSLSYPTLEIRVADVPITAEESALYAALVRALVVHVGAAVDQGDQGPRIEPELLRLAYWRAARDGLDGHGVDPRTGRTAPARELLDELLDEIRPALIATGDHDLIMPWLAALRASGTGAARQRAVAAAGPLTGVVDYLVEATATG